MTDKERIHFTHTGPEAGQVVCGLTRQEALGMGHMLQHPAYNRTAYEGQLARLCPNCRAVWFDEESTDEHSQRAVD